MLIIVVASSAPLYRRSVNFNFVTAWLVYVNNNDFVWRHSSCDGVAPL